jgi:hypothetical protein
MPVHQEREPAEHLPLDDAALARERGADTTGERLVVGHRQPSRAAAAAIGSLSAAGRVGSAPIARG